MGSNGGNASPVGLRREEGSQCQGGMQEPSWGLAAVAQLSGTTGSEENASRSLHTQRQLGCFLCALSASYLWGSSAKQATCRP